MMLVTLVVVVTAWLSAEPLIETRLRAEVVDSLEPLADQGATSIARGESPEAIVDRLARAHSVYVAVRSHGVWTRSGAGPTSQPPDADSGLVHEAGVTWVYVDREVGTSIVRIARPLPSLAAARQAVRETVAIASVIAILLAALVGEYLSRSIGRPLEEMTAAADALRRGDFGARVRSRRADELGQLGAAIDQMADQLVDRFEVALREEGRLRTVLDAMVEAVFVTDDRGRIVVTNAALSRLAGSDCTGRTAVEAVRSPELHEAVQRALRGWASEVQLELRIGDEPRSLAAHVAPLPRNVGVVTVLHDVTDLKRADSVRRDFVANASHELRTPLTAIRGFAETLRDGALEEPAVAQRFVRSIAENALRLSQLVDDLLELSRAESPEARFELAPVDVRDVAAKVLSGLEGRAAGKAQKLELDAPDEEVRVRGDARALDQVLLNLVDNAIKYTPDDGVITVRIRRESERVAIEVSDTGPGIPRAHQARIFERFYRVDKGRARAQGGTGLGLSIVKHLVQRMGGEIAVRSKVGQGSTFRVLLAAA